MCSHQSESKLGTSTGSLRPVIAAKPLANALEMVRLATINDLDRCFEIEKSLREDRSTAALNGFLLSGGDSRERYDEFLSNGPFYVFEVESSVVGFVFALSPSSPRMQNIKQHPEKLTITDKSILADANLAWLAKVGVAEEMMGRGIATALYQVLLREHRDWSFITTTVAAPICNLPSEKLHERFGFNPIGKMKLGDRGAFKDVICTVQYRKAGELI